MEEKNINEKKVKSYEYNSCEDKIDLRSWHSFGSPIGMSLGFAICVISIGAFIYLLHLSGLIGK